MPVWTNEATIALLALLVTCIPPSFLIWRCVRRRRRQRQAHHDEASSIGIFTEPRLQDQEADLKADLETIVDPCTYGNAPAAVDTDVRVLPRAHSKWLLATVAIGLLITNCS